MDIHVYVQPMERCPVSSNLQGWACAELTLNMTQTTDRFKALLFGKGGENLALVPIEYHVKKADDSITARMLGGDRRRRRRKLALNSALKVLVLRCEMGAPPDPALWSDPLALCHPSHAEWNPAADHIEAQGFSKGTRSLHQNGQGRRSNPFRSRELCEWQAGSVSDTAVTYLKAMNRRADGSDAPSNKLRTKYHTCKDGFELDMSFTFAQWDDQDARYTAVWIIPEDRAHQAKWDP
eukprot:gene1124-215_t